MIAALIIFGCAIAAALLTAAARYGDRPESAEDAATVAWAQELHHDTAPWWADETPGDIVPAFLPPATRLIPAEGVPAAVADAIAGIDRFRAALAAHPDDDTASFEAICAEVA